MKRVHLIKLCVVAATMAACGLLGAPGGAVAAPVFLGPTPYLSFADSPFNGGAFSYFHLETFEDGALNTPGATASAGWNALPPGPLTDSVDGDDGAIDGSGAGGHSFYSGNVTTSLTISFSAAALGGHLPTHVGIVWTDVGIAAPLQGQGEFFFRAFDANGLALGGLGPVNLGNGGAGSSTPEDRFFGVTNLGAISRIVISNANSVDWEVDHLQYGFQPAALPEPGSLLLLIAAVLAMPLGVKRRGPECAAGGAEPAH